MNSQYYLQDKQFMIEAYDQQKTFASFLPGVAGTNGIPMWVYYTNRGQGIAGFGVENKDGSIMDFVPANQAYKRTELTGFRTFIKKNGQVHEIFSSAVRVGVKRKMIIEANAVGFEECNETLDLCVTVKYFTITNQPFPGLVRKVKVSSISGKPSQVEVLDGLMTLWPYGNDNETIKNMSNLAVAWFESYNTENNIPFFRNRSTTNDSAEVGTVEAGHFYASYANQVEGALPVFYDPDVVFGQNTGGTRAQNFEDNPLKSLLAFEQVSANKIPCAFSAYEGLIDEPLMITSVVGKMSHIDILNETAKSFDFDFFANQEIQAHDLGDILSDDVNGKTAYPVFDAYVKQSYFDNLLRGGYPLVFDGKEGPIVYHVYSRIHGDMEREYNNFHVEPAYYSQGVGAFRDVNQNRRNDVYFVKEAGLYNVKQFMEFIQLDGQNPLSIQGSKLKVDQDGVASILSYVNNDQDMVKKILESEFTPGHLLTTIDTNKIELSVDKDTFIKEVMSQATQEIKAAYGHGYWVDHWTYNMDLVDNYLNIYPDKFETLLFEEDFRYFLSPASVLARHDKYVLNKEGEVRQYDAVITYDERVEALGIDPGGCNWQNTKDGQVVTSNLFEKLVSLVLNKMTNMDQSGIGIMMNTDKPGWNDAMNGLPGLFGSGTSESIEVKRIVKLLIKAAEVGRDIHVPNELADMLFGYLDILSQNLSGNLTDLDLYENAQNLKEAFNDQIAYGTSGEMTKISNEQVKALLNAINTKLEKAINLAIEMGDGIMPSYLVHYAKDYEVIEGKYHPINGLQNVKVSSWESYALPLYLEAPARYLKQLKDKEAAKKLYDKIKQSGMYDEALGMYITSETLENESMEIGRARAFVPGWLERESVFMHMEYKYLLGLVKSGLYSEFFEVIKTALPPFMDPAVYGRSPLENSSFIASSVNPNKANHGRGFVSRLTGTTSEMTTMWLHMMTGMKLFELKGAELHFSLKPVLPSDFFDENNEVRCSIFGDTTIIYNNQSRKSTFGENAARIMGYILTDKEGRTHSCEKVYGELAESIRDGKIKTIEVQLG